MTETLVAKAAPNFTVAPDLKLLPFRVTSVLPPMTPIAGEMAFELANCGTPANVNWTGAFADCGPGVVETVTVTAPGVDNEGVVQVMLVVVTVPSVQVWPPTVTDVEPGMKLVPVKVIPVPTLTGPASGEKEVTVGGGM